MAESKLRLKKGSQRITLAVIILSAVSIICFAVWASTCLSVPQDKPNDSHLSAEMRAVLDEANRNFTFNGKPIHPFLIKEFSTWLSDNTSPVSVSVDVASAAKARNEYNSSNVEVEGSRVRSDNPGIEGYSGWTGFYQYERLGTLKNGLHVLRISDCGGGSGIFQDLFFVRFTTDSAYDENGDIYERLLMSVVRTYVLGDRAGPDIELRDNTVIVSSSKDDSSKEILKF